MKALDNAKAIYDLTMNERCEEKVQVLFSNGLHKLMIDLIEELEERQKEDEYIYQNMKESLSMGNKAQGLCFVEVYQIINKRLNKYK